MKTHNIRDTADALIADICDPVNIHDDTLRLIYADWLEEHGQEARAEFIRVQCELARDRGAYAKLREHMHSPQRGAGGQWVPPCRLCDEMTELEARLRPLEGRERELFSDLNALEWCRGLRCGYVEATAGQATTGLVYGAHSEDGKEFAVEFRRGFVAEVILPLAAWYGQRCGNCDGTGNGGGHGPALVQTIPLEKVLLSDRKPLWQDQRFWWEESNYGNLLRGLPTEIFTHMRPVGKSRTGTQPWKHLPNLAPFATEAAAIDAASLCCLRWARSVNTDTK